MHEVIEELSVTKTLMRAKELYGRWDDAWDSALTVLGHDPLGRSDPIDDTEYRLLEIPKAASVKFPGLAVIFKVRGNKVIVGSVRFELDGLIVHSAMFANAAA